MQMMFTLDYGYGEVKVIGWERYSNGDIIIARNNNPLLGSSVYTIDFNCGTCHEDVENLITVNMYSQVYEEVQ